mgnify:CR=1 FL=1
MIEISGEKIRTTLLEVVQELSSRTQASLQSGSILQQTQQRLGNLRGEVVRQIGRGGLSKEDAAKAWRDVGRIGKLLGESYEAVPYDTRGTYVPR